MRNSLVHKTPQIKLGKPLTKQLIFTKTRNDNLQGIKNLNLWGNDLQDLSLLNQMPNLEVISLSVNNIKTLKYFQNSFKLQELYLRKNDIRLLQQIQYLVNLPELRVLWLCDNPWMLPNLVKLDNDVISEQERLREQYMRRSQEQEGVKKNLSQNQRESQQRNNSSNIKGPQNRENNYMTQNAQNVRANNSQQQRSLNQYNQNIQRSSLHQQEHQPKPHSQIKNNNFMLQNLQQNKSQLYPSTNTNNNSHRINSMGNDSALKIIQTPNKESPSSPLKPSSQNNNSSNYVNMKFEPFQYASSNKNNNSNVNVNNNQRQRNRMISNNNNRLNEQSGRKDYQNSGRRNEKQGYQRFDDQRQLAQQNGNFNKRDSHRVSQNRGSQIRGVEKSHNYQQQQNISEEQRYFSINNSSNIQKVHKPSLVNQNRRPTQNYQQRTQNSYSQNQPKPPAKLTSPNVLMAIISLIDDLDQDGLQIIHRQTQKKLKELLNQNNR